MARTAKKTTKGRTSTGRPITGRPITGKTSKGSTFQGAVENWEKQIQTTYHSVHKEAQQNTKHLVSELDQFKNEIVKWNKQVQVTRKKRVATAAKARSSNNNSAHVQLKKAQSEYESCARKMENLKDKYAQLKDRVKHSKLAEKKIVNLEKATAKFYKQWDKKVAASIRPARRKRRQQAA